MSITMINLSREDVVLVAFPFVTQRSAQRKRKPALVVQSDRFFSRPGHPELQKCREKNHTQAEQPRRLSHRLPKRPRRLNSEVQRIRPQRGQIRTCQDESGNERLKELLDSHRLKDTGYLQ